MQRETAEKFSLYVSIRSNLRPKSAFRFSKKFPDSGFSDAQGPRTEGHYASLPHLIPEGRKTVAVVVLKKRSPKQPFRHLVAR